MSYYGKYTAPPPVIPPVFTITEILNSNENNFNLIQDAIDDLAGNGWVYIPPGTYNEVLTIANDYVSLIGSGWSTLIDGLDNSPITINANYCKILHIGLQNTYGSWMNEALIYLNGSHFLIEDVNMITGDGEGINGAGVTTHNGRIINCNISATRYQAILLNRDDNIIIGNRIYNVVSSHGINISATGDNIIINGNIINTINNDGIRIQGNNCVVSGNRVTGVGGISINDIGATSTITGNDIT